MTKYKIVIVDDHMLMSNALKKQVESYQEFEVIAQAGNGKELLTYLSNNEGIVDLILLDVNMPVMDGREAMVKLSENYPDLKVLVLSVADDEKTILDMIRKGAMGYVMKAVDPNEFRKAMLDVIHKGIYRSELVSRVIAEDLQRENEPDPLSSLSDREIEFLRWVCKELTYKEIAAKMFVSPKTVDGYRESLFKKINVKSRTGLVIFAIENGLCNNDEDDDDDD